MLTNAVTQSARIHLVTSKLFEEEWHLKTLKRVHLHHQAHLSYCPAVVPPSHALLARLLLTPATARELC
jgi:hypothetical protein